MTVANIDFEIRSALDLTAAGAHLTASHPTTRILCMGWALDGMQEQMWWPGMPFPVELANHILAGGEVHAWNAAYERVNWPLMVAHHGAPDVRPEQWRCTMVRALLQGFPAKLEHAGPSMGLGECKDAEGHRLMLQVTKPRKVYRPGDANYDLALELALQDPGLLPEYEWFREEGKLCVAQWWVDEPRLTRLGNYCKQDVRVERKAGRFLDPLPPLEHEGWLLDQRINDRGFKIDMELVQAARALMKPALADANRKLAKLTDGELRSVTKPNEIRAWLNQRLGLELDSIGKDVLGILLVECPMDDTTRAVINLRLAAAKTSTAKLNALVRGVGDDHIMRGGLQFAGAGRTNRWAGRRFQPHNLPRPPKWAVRAVPYVLERNLEWLEALFDMPLEVISAILRSCIVAREGGELMAADYNAIEARLTAWFAGAAKLLEAYRTGKDPYRIMAATVFGVSDWTTIGKDSFERWLGKKIILGCFAADTLVLTRRGWVPICSVQGSDLVWDGVSWVHHAGVAFQGVKPVVEYAGVRATPDHRVLTPGGWQPFRRVRDADTSYQKSVHALVNLPSWGTTSAPGAAFEGSGSRAVATLTSSTGSTPTVSCVGPAPDATLAPKRQQESTGKSCSATPMSCRTRSTGNGGSPDGTASTQGVTGRGAKPMGTMAAGASNWPGVGMTVGGSCVTFNKLKAGTTRLWNWIVSTLTAITPPVMSAWPPAPNSSPTPAEPSAWSTQDGSGVLRTSPWSFAPVYPPAPSTVGSKGARAPSSVLTTSTSPGPVAVYDIVNAGPRNRFTIWTANGPLIVHNCGFGMGEKRFWESCREEGQFIDRSLAQLSVRAYRDDNWEIPEAWNALQQAAISAVQTPGTWVRAMLRGTPEVWFYRDDRYLRMRLPSGRLLSYLSPRLLDDETPWGAHRYRLEFWGWNGTRNRMEWQNLYGGRLMENLAQATARDIMLDAMLRLDREGWGLILTIHDEILTDNKKGALALDTMLAHMSRGPQWAEGLPLLAEGWTGHRYRK